MQLKLERNRLLGAFMETEVGDESYTTAPQFGTKHMARQHNARPAREEGNGHFVKLPVVESVGTHVQAFATSKLTIGRRREQGDGSRRRTKPFSARVF
jgi:hypothetical protein